MPQGDVPSGTQCVLTNSSSFGDYPWASSLGGRPGVAAFRGPDGFRIRGRVRGGTQGRVAGLAFMDFGAVAVQAQPVVKGLLSGTLSVRPSATAFMGAAFFQV